MTFIALDQRERDNYYVHSLLGQATLTLCQTGAVGVERHCVLDCLFRAFGNSMYLAGVLYCTTRTRNRFAKLFTALPRQTFAHDLTIYLHSNVQLS